MCFLKPMLIFLTCFCDITNTWHIHTPLYMCTQAHVWWCLRSYNTNADLVLFVVYASFCVLHFKFSFLTELVPQKSSGAVGKGKNCFNNHILCTCEIHECIETIWKAPRCRGISPRTISLRKQRKPKKLTAQQSRGLWILLGEYECWSQQKTCHGEHSGCS